MPWGKSQEVHIIAKDTSLTAKEYRWTQEGSTEIAIPSKGYKLGHVGKHFLSPFMRNILKRLANLDRKVIWCYKF